ncbi:MAG TPA: hypothetical protein VFS00_16310 [Polyangiaceae bacterium]|nr:hypothetical protein [Polyangiaceae bacterium]
MPSPTAGLVAWLEAYPLPILVALAWGALVARALERDERRPRTAVASA